MLKQIVEVPDFLRLVSTTTTTHQVTHVCLALLDEVDRVERRFETTDLITLSEGVEQCCVWSMMTLHSATIIIPDVPGTAVVSQKPPR